MDPQAKPQPPNAPRRSKPPAELRKRISGFITRTWRRDDGTEEADAAVRCKPGNIDTLCAQTRFTRKELRHLYRNFKEECPMGMITQQRFAEIFAQLFPYGDSKAYATLVFRSFDQDKDGQIHFDDLVRHLSTISRGSTEEKLSWIFTMYDTSDTSRLTFADLHAIIRSVHTLVGRPAEENDAQNEASWRAKAQQIFKDMDETGSGYVTPDQFNSWCLKNSGVGNSLQVFDTIL